MNRSQLALSIGAAWALATAPVWAEETSNNEEPERIEVTGSHIKRIDMEGASPVTVLSAEDLINTGFSTVGDALRSSNLNSFGSWGGGANNGWGSQSTVALKGSSAFHTLVLLDGHRMAKSPVMDGGAANLNTIPMAAVERIEILTDGASAIYGTDAIAGVINIILRKEFSGVEVAAKGEWPEAEGGESNHYTFTGGISGDLGSVVFTWEHYERDAIFMKDRDYSRNQLKEGGDPRYVYDYTGLSASGRTLVRSSDSWDYLVPLTSGDCSAYNTSGKNEFFGPLEDASYPNDRICAYDYTLEAAIQNDQRRDNALVNYRYNINDEIALTARAYWAYNETIDTSAPTPAGIWFDKDLPSYTTAEGHELVEVFNGDHMLYRFNTMGNRRAEHNDSILDFMIALDGSHDLLSWDFSFNHNRYNNFTWGQNYIHTPSLTDAVGDYNAETGEFEGWDPRDPYSEVPDAVKANYDKRNESSYWEAMGGVSVDVFELPGGTTSVYVGASYREEAYRSEVDAQAEAGNVYGGNGGAGGTAEREVWAAYFEMLFPILDNLELNVAGRYDDYSDFGDTFNPQVALRYNPIEDLMFRASWGTGFRAPTLTDLYSGLQEGYGWRKNYVRCYDNGTSPADCGEWDYAAAYTGGNEDLEPEESESYNFGAVWNIGDNHYVKADYWHLELENLIQDYNPNLVLLSQVFLWENGVDEYIGDVVPGLGYEIGANGRLQGIYSLTGNFGASEREGLDIELGGNYETQLGDIGWNLAWSHYLKYTEEYTDEETGETAVSEDKAGRKYYPDDRINVSVDWTLGDHAVALYAYYISKQENDWVDPETGVREVYDQFDSYTSVNASYTYHLPWQGSLSVGGRNLFDEDPRLDENGETDTALYDIRGRTWYATYKQSF
ncbi:TonB-dependent receptor [Ferrimonas balearica DSM 9799]|uniref:TonB-dependent receptor n=1 Tax=Ferrimonas balearica (strain DSM 9799 / CCM 4581 / KCTC 23876 / PAT) TaxID=550540 RepID=E1SQW7_FERBD|nr:TonB-dependent receptor [Ferrimonas balearica]ADN76892.1 TonB-dependent receptor [Ferrimonas balearica DSM 9799]